MCRAEMTFHIKALSAERVGSLEFQIQYFQNYALVRKPGGGGEGSVCLNMVPKQVSTVKKISILSKSRYRQSRNYDLNLDESQR